MQPAEDRKELTVADAAPTTLQAEMAPTDVETMPPAPPYIQWSNNPSHQPSNSAPRAKPQKAAKEPQRLPDPAPQNRLGLNRVVTGQSTGHANSNPMLPPRLSGSRSQHSAEPGSRIVSGSVDVWRNQEAAASAGKAASAPPPQQLSAPEDVTQAVGHGMQGDEQESAAAQAPMSVENRLIGKELPRVSAFRRIAGPEEGFRPLVRTSSTGAEVRGPNFTVEYTNSPRGLSSMHQALPRQHSQPKLAAFHESSHLPHHGPKLPDRQSSAPKLPERQPNIGSKQRSQTDLLAAGPREGHPAAPQPAPAPSQPPPADPSRGVGPAGSEAPGDSAAQDLIPGESVPGRLNVICNGNKGVFIPARQVIVCLCDECCSQAAAMGVPEMELSPTDFERHSGSCTSKKWKYTVKVLEHGPNGPVPGMNVGTWIEKFNPNIGKSRGRTLGYSSMFGDMAPSQRLARTASTNAARASRPTPPPSRKSESATLGPRASLNATPTVKSEGAKQAEKSREVLFPERHPAATDKTLADRLAEEFANPAEVSRARMASTMTKPSGEKWLATGKSKEISVPEPEIRMGDRYQAKIPACRSSSPPGREEDDPRAGVPGPSPLEALAIAAGYEKAASDAMHFDAVSDPDYHPGAVYDVRKILVDRNQRQRKKPRWLENSADPSRIQADKQWVTADQEEQDDILSWRPRNGKRKSHSQGREEAKRSRLAYNILSEKGLARHDSQGAPRILNWQTVDDGLMRITVVQNGTVFKGALMVADPGPERERVRERERMPSPRMQAASESESEVWDASHAGGDSRRSSGWNATGARQSEAPEVESGKHVSRRSLSAEKPKNQNRRILADQDYERLRDDGPPAGQRCAMCHELEDPQYSGIYRTEEGGDNADFKALERQEEGLGPFMLVRVSAIMNAWVHLQCALWSPEVYVNNDGDVIRASDATRRGRMIKCKLCGEKGATLGCHKRSCRASFHLTCARTHDCALQGIGREEYVVTCPEHVEVRRKERVGRMPTMPDQKLSDIPERPIKRPRSTSTKVDLMEQGAKQTGWNMLPSSTANLDTLTAAARAAESEPNLQAAVNPMAAKHFGGTVGQSSLRPGRCAVCVVQRKGVCGTQTAPKRCLRRIALDAAGREIPEAPPGWRTRKPIVNWPAVRESSRRSESAALQRSSGTPGSGEKEPSDGVPDQSPDGSMDTS